MINAYFNQPLGALSPHVYAIAQDAFKDMRMENQSQSILVSGTYILPPSLSYYYPGPLPLRHISRIPPPAMLISFFFFFFPGESGAGIKRIDSRMHCFSLFFL